MLRSLTLRPASGHRAQRSKFAADGCARPKGGVDPDTRGASGAGRDWRPSRRAPEERLVPKTVPWQSQAGRATESNRAQSPCPAPFSSAPPAVPSRNRGQVSECPKRSLLPEGAETRCVGWVRANPVCQRRAPGTHVDAACCGGTAARVNDALHGASSASAASLGAAPAFSSGTALDQTASDASEACATAAPCDGRRGGAPNFAASRARVNGAERRETEVSSEARSASLPRRRPPFLPIDVRPEHDPGATRTSPATGFLPSDGWPPRPRAAAHDRNRAPPAVPSVRARVWLRGGPDCSVTRTRRRDAPWVRVWKPRKPSRAPRSPRPNSRERARSWL